MELDFSKQIRALHEMDELDINLDPLEQNVSDESWAEEKNKGKTLNKPFRTPKGPKKFSVYVKNKNGNVVKVNFGDPNMEIKRDDPARRKSFRARHNCSEKKDKTKAGYWSCKQWRAGTKVKGSDFDITDEEFDLIMLDELDESEAGKTGLWDNIRKKKEREGKNYKAAKPGDKDRPDPKSWKKAQKKKSKADDKAGYPPKCNEGYEEKDGKCVLKKKKENKLRPGQSKSGPNCPNCY